ncbi:cyclodeaminase/cyclohydrolase family protein [Candidatus Poseidoniales archaeon]|nr:cyclodeaminase/cyclohydrolase family protein [Candidatus Poseidoniales archaeon]
MKWADVTLKEFQSALASSAPTPGGGSAAAVALGQAAALAKMVADLTLGNDKYSDGWTISDSVNTIATPLLEEGLELAQLDSQAFDAVVSGFKLPKSTEQEKEIRRDEIRTSMLGAAKVPYDTACHALDLLKLLPDLAMLGNENAVSDVGVASLLASAALKGAIFNIEINLNSLPESYGVEMRAHLPELSSEAKIHSRLCMETVRQRLANE